MNARNRSRREVLGIGLYSALLATACGQLDDRNGTSSSRIKVPPGPGARATIQEALNAGQWVDLVKGTYDLDAPLFVPSGGRLYGSGSGLTVLKPAWSPDPSLADERSNSVIVVRGVVDPKVTQLSVSVPPRSETIAMADTSILSGQFTWLEISGGNGGVDEYEMSDGTDVVLTELVKVTSFGSTLSLESQTMQFHAAGVEIRAAIPVEDVIVSGFDIAAETGTIAVGIEITSSVEVRVEDISGAGFSRAMIDVGPGCRSIDVQQLFSRGAVNSIVHCDSAVQVSIDSVRSAPDGERSHPLGIPRALLTFRERCTAVNVSNAILQRACIGIRTWGGRHISFTDVTVRDMDIEEALARDPLLVAGAVGVGVDGGANPLEVAEFALDVTFTNVHVEDCCQPTEWQSSWYLHDILGVTLNGCSIVNRGLSPIVEGKLMYGLMVVDSVGTADQFTVQGVNWAVRTRNALARISFGQLSIAGSSGSGYNGQGAIFLDHAGGPGWAPVIDRLEMDNVTGAFATGPSFDSLPDWALTMSSYRHDGLEAHDLVVAKVNTDEAAFGWGEIGEFDPTAPAGERRLRTPLGPSTACAAVCTGTPTSRGTDFVMVAPLPDTRAFVLCSVDAVAIGDLLVASATHLRRAETNNEPPTPYVVLGKALSSKADGMEGLVQVGAA